MTGEIQEGVTPMREAWRSSIRNPRARSLNAGSVIAAGRGGIANGVRLAGLALLALLTVPPAAIGETGPPVAIGRTATATTTAQTTARTTTGQTGSLSRPTPLHPCAAATERCDGELRVPLDWDDPESDSITIAFAWIPRSDATRPAAGTILANFGGPSPAIPAVPALQAVLGPVLERQNLLVVDPRGLGESSPLRCPGLTFHDRDAVAACAGSLGPRVQFFASDQVVRDMDAARAALGVEMVTFYGNSYGTVFAQAYAARYPERVRAVYLDSVVLVGEDGYLRDTDPDVLNAVRVTCSRSPACRSRHADPGETIERLLVELRTKPDSAAHVASVLPLLQGANVVAVREAVAAADAYLSGDRAPLHRLTIGFRPGGLPPMEDPDLAGSLAIYCADARFAFDRDATREDRRRQLEDAYSERSPFAPFEFAEIESPIDWAIPCANWPTPRESPPVPPNARYPEVPVLIAAGDFDTTPTARAAALLERFPNASLLRVRYGIHAQALGNECARGVARDFLADPRHPAPGPAGPEGCTVENYRAVGAFARTMAELRPAEGEALAPDEGRLVAGVFATAADIVARLNPTHRAMPPRLVALRGGEVRWDAETRRLTLDEVRYVEDLAVTGTVDLAADHTVTAELQAKDADGRRFVLHLRWRAFVAEDATELAGLLDGSPFRAKVPGW